MLIVIGLLLLLAVAAVLWFIWWWLGAFFFRLYTRPPRVPIRTTPAHYGLRYLNVSFESEDGIPLQGWLVFPPDYREGERRAGVLVTHGYGANRSDIIERSVAVAMAGFVVLTFDWRCCGESGGMVSTGGLAEQLDMRAAVDFFLSRPEVDPSGIAVYGFSMGAVSAIIVAAEDPRIKAVVADSPYAGMWEVTKHILRRQFMHPSLFIHRADRVFRQKFGAGMRDVDAASAVAGLSPRPLLILCGERDRIIPSWHSRKVFEAAGEPKKIISNKHGGHFDNASDQLLREEIIPFLLEALVMGKRKSKRKATVESV